MKKYVQIPVISTILVYFDLVKIVAPRLRYPPDGNGGGEAPIPGGRGGRVEKWKKEGEEDYQYLNVLSFYFFQSGIPSSSVDVMRGLIPINPFISEGGGEGGVA